MLFCPAGRLAIAGHSVGPSLDQGGEIMQKILRRIAVVIGSVAVSAGLMAAVAVPAHADEAPAMRAAGDSSWGR
jgi:hypothetical protein